MLICREAAIAFYKGADILEEWKEIIGYEGLYEISSYGNIRNMKTGKIRNLQPGKNGYVKVDLYKDGDCSWFRVHRLVAEAFIPNPLNLPVVMHLDNDKSNNYYLNLKWGTVSENTKQAFDDELICTADFFMIYNGEYTIICRGYNELIEYTGYGKSQLNYYIKYHEPLKKGNYKGYIIEKIS